MRKTYPFVIAFLLSAVIVFSVANVLVLKYEKRARGELEKNVFLIIDAIQSRLQTFLDVENDRDLLSTVMREIMDENEDLVCVRILDSLHNPYFEIGKDNACSEYAKFCNNKRDKKKNQEMCLSFIILFMVYLEKGMVSFMCLKPIYFRRFTH